MPRRTPTLLALGITAGMLPLFFVDLGPWRRVFAPEMHVFGHLLFFALISWVLLQLPVLKRHPFAVRAGSVILLALVLGTSIELIQPSFGRSAALKDVWQNLLGAALAVAIAAPAGAQRRLLGALVGVVLVVELHLPAASLLDRGVARIQFPVLADFTTPLEHRRWSLGEPDDHVARIGRRSLRLDLEPGRYAGTILRRSFGDWAEFGALEFSLYNPGAPLGITVSIRDHAHFDRGGAYADRFNRRFTLTAGWNDIRIPVADIRNAPRERSQQLDDLAELAIFTTNLEEPRTLYLDRVRLTE